MINMPLALYVPPKVSLEPHKAWPPDNPYPHVMSIVACLAAVTWSAIIAILWSHKRAFLLLLHLHIHTVGPYDRRLCVGIINVWSIIKAHVSLCVERKDGNKKKGPRPSVLTGFPMQRLGTKNPPPKSLILLCGFACLHSIEPMKSFQNHYEITLHFVEGGNLICNTNDVSKLCNT